MSETKILDEQLVIGRSLLISSTTQTGHVQFNAEISSIGGHHFKVRAARPVPRNLLIPQQPLKIRLLGDSKSTLPLTCRFLRVDDKRPQELILSFPEGEWITNRRAFVRAQITLPVTVVRHSGQRIEGETIDVSGGGCLTRLKDNLSTGEMVFLKLGPLPDTEETLEFDAKMVRTVEMNVNRRNGSEMYIAFAFKFVKAPTRAQNKVCKMVIVEQFEQRRAELREFVGKEK
ncbi:MAG: PilZ domain-containing protein [Deltaproteobacteria bacterium]|nr:PilZ domain-containing protein [Deltaproteobacteria bacterium]